MSEATQVPGSQDDPLGVATAQILACAPQAAHDPRWAEALLAAAATANEEFARDEHIAYLRVDVPNRDTRSVLARVADAVDALRQEGCVHGWWWMEKIDSDGHHLRVRLHGPAPLRRAQLAALDPDQPPRALAYEPETALFGGPVGLRISHAFHQHDTEVVTAALRRPTATRALPAGLTVRVMEAVLQGAEIDEFERWDMWRMVARLRGALPERDDETYASWFSEVRAKAAEEVRRIPAFEPYIDAGARLASAHREGRLERAPRRVAVALFIFHANRAGHLPGLQRRLARAAVTALEPMPDSGTGGADTGGGDTG